MWLEFRVFQSTSGVKMEGNGRLFNFLSIQPEGNSETTVAMYAIFHL